MATSRIVTPSNNPYASGAVVLDSSPYTQFYINKQARDEANHNAFLKTFSDIGNNINAAGLDNKDIPELYNKKAAWQQYVLANNKAYMNPTLDNGKAYSEANKLFNDAMAHIATGKSKVANLAKASTILSDPTKAELLTEPAHQNLERARLPITDPNYQPWNTDDIYNPKPFGLTEANKLKTDLGGTFKGTQVSDVAKNALEKADPNTFKINRHFNTQYDNSDLIGMRGQAENLLHNNKGFALVINQEIKNPERVKQMDEIYGQHFKDANGKPLHIEHPEDFTTAWLINQNPNTGSKIKEETDESSKLASEEKIRKAAYNKAELDRRERQRRSIDAANQRAKDALTAGSDAPDKYITGSATGNKFKGSQLDELSFPKDVEKEFGKVIKVPNSTVDAALFSKGQPFKGKDITITPSFARNPSTGAIVAVYPVIDKKTGEVTTEPDMGNMEIVPYSKIRGVVGDKVINTKFKAGQYLGTPATKSTKGKPY